MSIKKINPTEIGQDKVMELMIANLTPKGKQQYVEQLRKAQFKILRKICGKSNMKKATETAIAIQLQHQQERHKTFQLQKYTKSEIAKSIRLEAIIRHREYARLEQSIYFSKFGKYSPDITLFTPSSFIGLQPFNQNEKETLKILTDMNGDPIEN
jgi:hypothetical protein